MGFDLLTNPFAILDLPADAPVAEIMACARQLANAEAAAASRALLIPRERLLAELSYLPGTPQDFTGASVAALRAGQEPALQHLKPLARCNVLAHLASHGTATASHLRELAELQDAIRPATADLVGAARQQAGMPSVPGEMLDSALDALVSRQADAFCEGMLAASDGANLFAAILLAAPPEATARASFLRQSAAAWERATASEVARDLEIAASLEADLRDRPDPAAADRLAAIVSRFAIHTKPPRIASRLVGLPHAASVDAARRWRLAALDLNNRQDAVLEAVRIFKALAEGFGTEDELGALTARDLKICRERLALGEGTPEMRRLNAAIAAAETDARAFQHCEIINGKPTGKTPASVLELYEAFVAATGAAVSDLPWRVLRVFALRLHKEFSATAAASAFTELAVAQGADKVFASEIVRAFILDRQTLQQQQLTRDAAAAPRSNKRVARLLLSELLTIETDTKEWRSTEEALRRWERQRRKRTLRYAFFALCLSVLINHIVSSGGPAALPRNNPHPRSPGRYDQASISSRAAPGTAAPADPDAGQPERQPAAGSAPLTRAEVRWCRYQFARIEAARNYLRATEANPAYPAERFNAGVDGFNAFVGSARDVCAGRHYQDADGSVVDAELRLRSQTLALEGERVVASAMQSAEPRALQAPSSAAQAITPASTARPAPTIADPVAYAQGQEDRRAWETWFSGLRGAARDGAEWWASVRSARRPPSCNQAPGVDHAAAASGCIAARGRLANIDRRRHTEADYWWGWNNP